MNTGQTLLPSRQLVVRAAGAIAATLAIGLLFITSYVGALHAPTPHDVPIVVTRQIPAAIVTALSEGDALNVTRVDDLDAASRAIEERDAYGSVGRDATGRLQVTVAPAASPAVAQLLRTEVVAQLKQARQDPTLKTVHALPADDSRGTVGFYLAIGWVLAGYFGATLLGLAMGTRINARRVLWRITALAILGLLASLSSTAICSTISGFPGGFSATALIGMLTVLAVGTATVAFQSLLGVGGTGLAILLFVVLGNPGAGGAAPAELLPGFWRTTGQLLPNGAAVTGIRNAVYFPDASLAGPILVLVAWFVAAAALAFLLGARGRGLSANDAEASLAAAAVA